MSEFNIQFVKSIRFDGPGGTMFTDIMDGVPADSIKFETAGVRFDRYLFPWHMIQSVEEVKRRT